MNNSTVIVRNSCCRRRCCCYYDYYYHFPFCLNVIFGFTAFHTGLLQRASTMTATNHDDQRYNLVKFVQRCREWRFLKSTPLYFSRLHYCDCRSGIHVPCGRHGLWPSWPVATGHLTDPMPFLLPKLPKHRECKYYFQGDATF